MKVFFIALFILCINLALGAMSVTDLFPDVLLDYDSDPSKAVQDSYETLGATVNSVEDTDNLFDTLNAWWDQLKGLGIFVTIVSRCIFPNILLHDVFGLDGTIALLVSVPIYMFYVIAIVQLLKDTGGRNSI